MFRTVSMFSYQHINFIIPSLIIVPDGTHAKCWVCAELYVAKCNLGNLGEAKLEPMLPAVLLICASNLRGRHPWNLQGRISCAWLRPNTADHRLPIFGDLFSLCIVVSANFCGFWSLSLPPV